MTELPDYYKTVAEEMLRKCHPGEGVWVDLGAGSGGVGLTLARQSTSIMVLIDPNESALQKALRVARGAGLGKHIVAITGKAEAIPLADSCIDFMVSRGSIFFWEDRAQGLREVRRVLCPGGVAMIGGGLGELYPEWARREFIRRRHESVKKRGPDAIRRFREVRSSQTFCQWAEEAGLTNFQVTGNGGHDPDSPQVGLGVWLRFRKEEKTI
jgi:ubiquinone/menaquinone biosynthesis C-methylase UbiE